MNLEKNRVKISYNPYQKQITYQWLGSNGEWEDVPSESPLSEDRYQNTTLQNSAVEIIDIIDKTYNTGTAGLDIIFEGTGSDYEDLHNIIQCYFGDKNIQCIPSGLVLISADEALTQIKKIFAKVEATFEKYPNEALMNEIGRFRDTVKTTVSICVMGLYSAGKSAFINALIGEEIMPSASDPTTAKTYRVSSSEQSKIHFQYNGKDINLLFSGNKYAPQVAAQLNDNELLTSIKQAIESSGSDLQSVHMYRALQVINEFEGKTARPNVISDVIDVEVPFIHSSLALDEFDYVIYDTPGSNSASNKRHMEILQEALKGQTNGLPIFLTTPDTMDSKDNNEIIDIIDQMAGALDRTNTMVIVNRADEKDSETLESKKKACEKLRISQWKSNRIFFMSAIMALGSKKQNPEQGASWCDRQYFKVYKKEIDSFTDPQDEFYLPLYRFNQLAPNRYDAICKLAENTPTEQKLAHTSGIAGIEDEINCFARKYSLYNKCKQAQEYLQNAINMAEEQRKVHEQELKKLQQNLEAQMSEKEQQLVDRLRESTNTFMSDISKQYTDELNTVQAKKIREIQDGCANHIRELWVQCRKTVKGDEKRLQKMEEQVKQHFSNTLTPVLNRICTDSEKFWTNAEQAYKESCVRVVNEDSHLSRVEKDWLNQFIRDSEPIEIEGLTDYFDESEMAKKKRFLFFKIGEKFSEKACVEAFKKNTEQTASYWIQERIQDLHIASFENWEKQFVLALQNRLFEFNPALRDLVKARKKCTDELKVIEKQRERMMNADSALTDLFDSYGTHGGTGVAI